MGFCKNILIVLFSIILLQREELQNKLFLNKHMFFSINVLTR